MHELLPVNNKPSSCIYRLVLHYIPTHIARYRATALPQTIKTQYCSLQGHSSAADNQNAVSPMMWFHQQILHSDCPKQSLSPKQPYSYTAFTCYMYKYIHKHSGKQKCSPIKMQG
ncbi:hypothetical protein ElyMa_001984000 [Elysia marginata]|uniref:Uncharacterized protein n=1 Tax=Elysia marginata TaxID=1093978 RepID=A0AAV4F0Q5_9GAST|nr:hypothetical protein ElyMa_001984000 [Elysia marginata]